MSLFKNDRGFTLIEIILAIAIVGILGVSVMAYFGNSARFIRETDVREQAVLISQQEMELAKATGYSGVGSYTPNEYPADAPYPEFEVSITVNDVTGVSGLKNITVETTWENTKNVSLESYIAER
jgi:prepilin-type N-terminal cleavage/methylation domain-containing protein